MRRRPGRAARRAVPLALALTAGLVLTGCSGGSDDDDQEKSAPAGDAREPVSVAIGGGGGREVQPDIGVLLAVSTDPGQGQDVLPGAQGAAVAAYRLGLDGGTRPDLTVEVDDGTADGARAAVERLVDEGVSGIVVASTGDHLTDAVGAASRADVPVLLPYWRPSGDLPDGVWTTGPSAAAVDARMLGALDRRGLDQPFLITADDVTAPGVSAAREQAYRGNNPDGLVGKLRSAVRNKQVDSVVIAASAPTQARITSVVQGRVPQLPVLLTPEALSPIFAEALAEDGGTASGRFSTVGADAADITTLGSDARAESAAAYFAGLRMAAGDPEALDVLGEREFAQVASGADVASHDAVVVLARAAQEAGSAAPAQVAEALAGLSLDGADGLAGPALDFATPSAMAADDVAELVGTTQDPGVRPVAAGDDTTRLFWFAVPADGADASADAASATG